MQPTSAAEPVRHSFDAIERTERAVRAWAWLDRDAASASAEQADRRPSPERGPLYGITIGVKDIIDVQDMPTVAGFAPFASRPLPTCDATVVQRLRAAGAVVVGKTVTTQFAVGDPPVTRNPWNLERTPGGSSSGSAAAVACGHVDLALGSQTTGSTLRPAAFCGVYGLKPTFDWCSRQGMLPLAESLDHIGLIGRSIDVILAVFDAASDPEVEREPVESLDARPPRLGVWREALALADPEIRALFDQAVTPLATAGAAVSDIDPFVPYLDIFAVQQVIFGSEGAAVHRDLHAKYPDDYGPKVRAFVEVGSAIPSHAYVRAEALRGYLRRAALDAWREFDAILLPSASTTAPARSTTGDTTLLAAATLFGFPAAAVPAGIAKDGLPWALQLISPSLGSTRRLLQVARWVDGQIPPLPAPPLVRGAVQ